MYQQQQKKKKFTPQIYNNPGSYQNQGSYSFGSRWQSIDFCQKIICSIECQISITLYNLKKKLILHLKFANIYIIEDIFVPKLYYSNLVCHDKKKTFKNPPAINNRNDIKK